jgi:hypothetical protein
MMLETWCAKRQSAQEGKGENTTITLPSLRHHSLWGCGSFSAAVACQWRQRQGLQRLGIHVANQAVACRWPTLDDIAGQDSRGTATADSRGPATGTAMWANLGVRVRAQGAGVHVGFQSHDTTTSKCRTGQSVSVKSAGAQQTQSQCRLTMWVVVVVVVL